MTVRSFILTRAYRITAIMHMKQLFFKEAARIDNSCAVAYWGQALAMGPGYNSAYGYAMGKGCPLL